MSILRRTAMLTSLSLCVCAIAGVSPAIAVTPAEAFVSENIDKGLGILNDKQLTQAQRKEQFAGLLLGVTDMRRIALFVLGRYAQTSTEADKEAYVAAFQHYATAVYQSYLAKYAGQTLQVVHSSERAPGDFVVVTKLMDTGEGSGQQPLEVDFRIRTDSGKPMLVDFSVAGIWLALEERDQFSAVLSQNNGSIPVLISHLDKIASQYD